MSIVSPSNNFGPNAGVESKPQLDLQPTLEAVRSIVAPIWPLQDLVAVNPYQGLADKRFLEARSVLRSVSDCEMLMPLDFYRQRYNDGVLKLSDIGTAINELIEEGVAGANVLSELQLIDWIRGEQLSGPDPMLSRSCWSFSREFDIRSATRWTDVISEELSKTCSAHYDLGQAPWASPWKCDSLYAAWRQRCKIDRRMEMKGLSDFRQFVADLPTDPEAAIAELLAKVCVPKSHWQSYLLTLAYETPGWSAFSRYQSDQAAKRGEVADDFLGLLAMRLAYDVAVAKTFDVHVDWLDRLHSPEPLKPESDPQSVDPNSGLVRYAMMRANEISYRRQVLSGLSARALDDDAATGRKLAQLVFCIDVRSERIRRNLEATSKQVDTFGFAGFFGLPIEYVPLGEPKGSNQLPVLVDPVMKVYEAIRRSGSTSVVRDEKHFDTKRDLRTFRKHWQQFQKSAVSCFTFVESVGLTYLCGLIRGMLRVPVRANDGLPKSEQEHSGQQLIVGPTLDGLAEQGFPITRLADFAEGILRNLGLTDGFARLVAFCGHASTAENNPLQSGLDCGACAGHSGESNARFAALLLNHAEIREILLERGIEIPSEVHFIGGLHNTTTDEINFFDNDLVPASHADDLREVQKLVRDAGLRTRIERVAKL